MHFLLRLLHALVFFALLMPCSHPAAHAAAADDDPPESPQVHADHRVTFRLDAPRADSVKLRGITRAQLDMKRGKRGVWSVTVEPLKPGLYEYSFVVDGESILDPSNRQIKPEQNPDSSLLEIPSNSPLFYQWRDVPHGAVHIHDYFSAPLKRVRAMRVYTPPGYDESAGRRFPVLYLLHGTGDTEATWTEFGRAHYIIDNLLSENKCVPMLLVMLDGHADLQEEEGIHRANLEKFDADLIQSAVPFVDKTYRTVATADGRAICGLSMGGFQSLYTGMNHPDQFAWLGAMSAFLPDAAKLCAPAFADPKFLNDHLRIFWHSIGKDDYLFKEYAKFDKLLEKHGILRDFHITAGEHSWTVWRQYLADFAPLLFRETKQERHAGG